VLFLEVALTESWVILITRMAQGPDSGPFVWPSWQLLGAVFGVDVLASTFALFGWISGPAPHGGWTSIVTVVRIWLFSFGVTVVVGLTYVLLSKIKWLNNIGRRIRSSKNAQLEDFLTEMRRMTLVHERDSQGDELYRFTSSSNAEPDGNSNKPKEKNQGKHDASKDAETSRKGGESGQEKTGDREKDEVLNEEGSKEVKQTENADNKKPNST